jgi:hypothetical protein
MLKTKVVRAFAHHIKNASTKELKPFFEQRVSHKAHVRVDKWRAYNAIKKDYNNRVQKKANQSKTSNYFIEKS